MIPDEGRQEYKKQKGLNSITPVILYEVNHMETVPAKVTKRLVDEMDELIDEGWYANKSELIRNAIRDLINRTKAERLEAAIKEDVEWGLSD